MTATGFQQTHVWLLAAPSIQRFVAAMPVPTVFVSRA
jgi:hypothetical protein